MNTLRARTIALIDDRTVYGQGLASSFARAVKAAGGGNIVATQYTSDKATGFNAILTSIKSKNPAAARRLPPAPGRSHPRRRNRPPQLRHQRQPPQRRGQPVHLRRRPTRRDEAVTPAKTRGRAPGSLGRVVRVVSTRPPRCYWENA
ncbi:hypothetical protein ABZY02_17580 [Streptomyces sp. NPDC006649]|uniref:hypothetical protein n=1 Tax=Streptomyces sp. NPDC006649 TaxID=3156896 RepID=UPI0033BE8EC7